MAFTREIKFSTLTGSQSLVLEEFSFMTIFCEGTEGSSLLTNESGATQSIPFGNSLAMPYTAQAYGQFTIQNVGGSTTRIVYF